MTNVRQFFSKESYILRIISVKSVSEAEKLPHKRRCKHLITSLFTSASPVFVKASMSFLIVAPSPFSWHHLTRALKQRSWSSFSSSNIVSICPSLRSSCLASLFHRGPTLFDTVRVTSLFDFSCAMTFRRATRKWKLRASRFSVSLHLARPQITPRVREISMS